MPKTTDREAFASPCADRMRRHERREGMRHEPPERRDRDLALLAQVEACDNYLELEAS